MRAEELREVQAPLKALPRPLAVDRDAAVGFASTWTAVPTTRRSRIVALTERYGVVLQSLRAPSPTGVSGW